MMAMTLELIKSYDNLYQIDLENIIIKRGDFVKVVRMNGIKHMMNSRKGKRLSNKKAKQRLIRTGHVFRIALIADGQAYYISRHGMQIIPLEDVTKITKPPWKWTY